MLDINASTGLLATFPALLGDVPSLEACADIIPEMLDTMRASGPITAALCALQGPWVARLRTKKAWQQVCSEVIPTLLDTYDKLTSGSQQQQDVIFHDVAVAAWTCCNPGCTNMAGQQEASLALSKCTGCGEARYCSK